MEKFFTLVEAEFSHSSLKLIRLIITVVSECLSYQRSIELQQIVQNHAIYAQQSFRKPHNQETVDNHLSVPQEGPFSSHDLKHRLPLLKLNDGGGANEFNSLIHGIPLDRSSATSISQ